MTQNLTIGFIGYGNMAQAIAQGFVDAGVVAGGQMVACAAHYDKLEKTTAELGVRPLRNALEVVTAADVVIIAIKPYQIAAVVKPLADELLFGRLTEAGRLTVDYDEKQEENSGIVLDIQPPLKKEPKAGKAEPAEAN